MPTAQAIEQLLKMKHWHLDQLRVLGYKSSSPERARQRDQHEEALESIETALSELGFEAPPVDKESE